MHVCVIVRSLHHSYNCYGRSSTSHILDRCLSIMGRACNLVFSCNLLLCDDNTKLITSVGLAQARLNYIFVIKVIVHVHT